MADNNAISNTASNVNNATTVGNPNPMSNIANVHDELKLFVGQIPRGYTEADVLTVFSHYGQIREASIIRDRVTRESRGCCFIIFAHRADGERCMREAHNQLKLPTMNRPVQINYSEMKEYKLFVTKLPREMLEPELTAMFEKYGRVREVFLMRDHGISKGCAFIKFGSQHEANAAIAGLNDTLVPGSSVKLVVRYADTKETKANRSGLNATAGAFDPTQMLSFASNPMLMAQLAAQFSNPATSMMNPLSMMPQQSHLGATDPSTMAATTTSTGMTDPQSMAFNSQFQAMINAQQQPFLMSSFPAQAAYAQQLLQQQQQLRKPPSSEHGPRGPEGANIFVYNIPNTWTEVEMRNIFSPFGRLMSATVYRDKITAESKGFGFVSYDTVESAQYAVQQLNGFDVGGRRLKVEIKKRLMVK